jgi:hypothetical protein
MVAAAWSAEQKMGATVQAPTRRCSQGVRRKRATRDRERAWLRHELREEEWVRAGVLSWPRNDVVGDRPKVSKRPRRVRLVSRAAAA